MITLNALARLLAILAMLSFGANAQITVPSAEFRKSFGIEEHYQQVIFVEGFPIIASEKVNPIAMEEAAHIVRSMLRERPDILRSLAARKIRLGIMSIRERTCDLPEHSKLEPKAFWNRRARGLGASRKAPCVSCGEENLLHNPGDPYPTENIMVHELAHTIHLIALHEIDPSFDARLRQTYEAAMKTGLWKGLYAAENHAEYWAEGVQSWFDTNRENDAIHNHVDTREELIEYDPALAKLCKEIFGENEWRYVRADDPSRKHEPHLKSLDRSNLKPFAWSQEEETAFRAAEMDRTKSRVPGK